MLPFLQKAKMQTGVIIHERKSDHEPEEGSEPSEGLEACASDIIKAISSSNSKALAQALQAAFEIMDSNPHEEYPHDEDESAE